MTLLKILAAVVCLIFLAFFFENHIQVNSNSEEESDGVIDCPNTTWVEVVCNSSGSPSGGYFAVKYDGCDISGTFPNQCVISLKQSCVILEVCAGEQAGDRTSPYIYTCVINEEFIKNVCCEVEQLNETLTSSCFTDFPKPTSLSPTASTFINSTTIGLPSYPTPLSSPTVSSTGTAGNVARDSGNATSQEGLTMSNGRVVGLVVGIIGATIIIVFVSVIVIVVCIVKYRQSRKGKRSLHRHTVPENRDQSSSLPLPLRSDSSDSPIEENGAASRSGTEEQQSVREVALGDIHVHSTQSGPPPLPLRSDSNSSDSSIEQDRAAPGLRHRPIHREVH